MGADIELYVQKREGDGWRLVGPPAGWSYANKGAPDWWIARDYIAFSLLADVRNYHELAPIADVRGLPADAGSFLVQQMSLASARRGSPCASSNPSTGERTTMSSQTSLKHTSRRGYSLRFANSRRATRTRCASCSGSTRAKHDRPRKTPPRRHHPAPPPRRRFHRAPDVVPGSLPEGSHPQGLRRCPTARRAPARSSGPR